MRLIKSEQDPNRFEVIGIPLAKKSGVIGVGEWVGKALNHYGLTVRIWSDEGNWIYLSCRSLKKYFKFLNPYIEMSTDFQTGIKKSQWVEEHLRYILLSKRTLKGGIDDPETKEHLKSLKAKKNSFDARTWDQEWIDELEIEETTCNLSIRNDLEHSIREVPRLLREWIEEDTDKKEKRIEAAENILRCFYNGSFTLDLSSLNLSSLPSIISRLTYLKSLQLEDNNLKDLPLELFELQNVQVLNLSSNLVKELPSEIFELKHLKKLDISFNQIEAIPASIGKLDHLTELNAGGNFFTVLPEEIGKLIKLKTLFLNQGELSKLPSSIANLSQLEILHCEGARFKELPDEISLLNSLKEIDFRSNQLHLIPKKILSLQSAMRIFLGHNDFSVAYIQKCLDGLHERSKQGENHPQIFFE